MQKNTVMFRFVPTMRCNFRCEYCFIDNEVKKNGITMFDIHPASEWIEAMSLYSDYDVELYFWGGEPFCVQGTYDVLREWTKMDHIISGIRIDTNIYFAEKIAKLCPTEKIKLNCSYHMQYHSLDEEFKKVKMLKELGMVGMVNFVASKYNLYHLKNDYGMTVKDLIELFAEIDVFVNIAGDFIYANNSKYEKYKEYRDFITQFVSQEDWRWLRGVNNPRQCTAGQKMFTVEYDGTFTSCISDKNYGNFFEGDLRPDSFLSVCEKECPSIVAYPFRCDNDFSSRNSLLKYIARSREYRMQCKQDYIDFQF